jgi:O-antigen/teichoic acid export membrane protein
MADQGRRRESLTGTRVLAQSTLWNIIGRLGPMLVALLATPLLLHKLGVNRWGVFTLALSLVGMFGVFDFGIGRVLTRAVAETLEKGTEEEAASLVWTGTILVTAFGVGGALLSSPFVPYLVRSVLNMPQELHREAILGMYVLAVAGPLVVLDAALWGVMSAFQKFAAANLVNIPVLIMYYLGPLAILYFYDSLIGVMAALVACRAAMTVGYWIICLKSMPGLRHARFDPRAIRPMLTFGGWITLSNILYPITLYLDRFVIGSLVSVSATAYYATPADLINRFWVVPIAAMNAARTGTLFRRSMVFISATVFPGCICAIALPGLLLDVWLGHEFSQHAAPILRLLGIGIFFSCLTFVPYGLIDGIGRFDVNAKLAAAQTAIYLPVLFVLVWQMGIHFYPPVKAEIWKVVPELAGACGLMVLPLLVPGVLERILVMGLVVLAYLGLVWLYSLTADERHYLRVKVAKIVRV